MQFVLSEEEYRELVPRKELNKALDIIEKLRLKVLEISNFECDRQTERFSYEYCDFCPLAKFDGVCKNKRFSK